MNYFYSSSVMGYGFGRKWHYKYDFPYLPRVTKTLTLGAITGIPFAIIKFGKSVWNRVGLHNIGLTEWLYRYRNRVELHDVIVSLAGTDAEISIITIILQDYDIAGIELNFSCPNHKSFKNIKVPNKIINKHPIYLKLSYDQDPYEYDLNDVAGIRLNSVPCVVGGLSGKAARAKNWAFIEQFNREGLNVAGCSFVDNYDLLCLKDLGCKEIGIGSTILTNPHLIEHLPIM